jgi:hypothetical protein
MSQTKLTIDIIAEYIRNNLINFKSTDEVVIVQKITKSTKSIEFKENKGKVSKINYNSLDDFVNNIVIKDKFPKNFFAKIPFVNFFENFLIFKPIFNFIVEEKKINYSLFSSILYSLNETYRKETEKYQLKSINNLISYIKSDIGMDGFKNNGYSKLKWTRNQILKDIDLNNITEKIIRCVSDILHINIFVINNDNIEYYGEDFIVFKKIIFLLKYNEYYYLLGDNNNYTFTFNSNELIKNILINPNVIKLKLCEKINYIGYEKVNLNPNTEMIKTEIEYTDRLNGYETESETASETASETETGSETKIKLNCVKYGNEEINEKLSLIELQKKAKELNINTFYFVNEVRKMKNKKELCEEILNKI